MDGRRLNGQSTQQMADRMMVEARHWRSEQGLPPVPDHQAVSQFLGAHPGLYARYRSQGAVERAAETPPVAKQAIEEVVQKGATAAGSLEQYFRDHPEEYRAYRQSVLRTPVRKVVSDAEALMQAAERAVGTPGFDAAYRAWTRAK